MRSCYCSNCGKRQEIKLAAQSKVTLNCPKCGKLLLAKRDKSGIAVKVFDGGEPP